jgi:hypothetical protein
VSGSNIKDPDATLDYGLDWAGEDPWLAAGETIQTSTWLVPAGLVKGSDSHTDTATTVWLSGGTLGVDYEVTNRITTNQARTDDRTIRIMIRER